jgi:hypothetical protein
MSMVRTITKDGVTVDLCAAPYEFTEEPDFGGVTHSAPVYRNPSADLPRFGRSDRSSPRSVPFSITVVGISADDCDSNVSALIDVLPDDDVFSTIAIGPDGGSHLGFIVARRIDGAISKPYTLDEYHHHRAQVSFTLACDPYVYAVREDICSVLGIYAPALVPLTAQTGQYKAPLDLLLEAGALELAGCYVAYTADEAAVIGDFVKPLVAATWSAGVAAADAAGYPAGAGNTCWRHNAAAYTDVDMTAYKPGDYLVLVNCKGTTANTDTVQHAYSGSVLIPTTTLKLLSLGVVKLPLRGVRAAATSTLRLTITGGGGGEYAYANHVTLLPVSDGLTGYARTSGHVHTLRWEDGTLYADDAVDLEYVVGGADPLRTLGGQLIVLAEKATPAPTTHLHATASADPRWEQFPSF